VLTRVTLSFILLIIACNKDSGSSFSPPKNDSSIQDAEAGCVNTFGVDESLPELLSQTGLYTNIEAKDVHQSVLAFEPEFQLWSDGAHKMRWVYVPECETIDTSDMNDWSFPVGTRFFKEFTVDGQRIETRLIERVGTGPYDFLYASYQWNADETEAALAAVEGVQGAKNTSHNIPSQAECRRCHGSHESKGGRPSRALGFSAFLLNHENAGVSIDDLVANDRLTHAPETQLQVPGNAVERAALGYLHINCGGCHNKSRDGVPQTDMNLWIDVNQSNVQETSAYRTAVGQPNKIFNDQHVTARIEPGQPEASSIIYRMSQRGNNAQMPPLGSEQVDESGLEAVRSWILSLP